MNRLALALGALLFSIGSTLWMSASSVGSQLGAMRRVAATEGRATSPVRTALAPQGSKILTDLADLTRNNWARVAGHDLNQRPRVNGHDEFLREWTSRALKALHGLDAGAIRMPFRSAGFPGLSAVRPAENVIVAVPGSRHPDQAVIVGAHPDGEPWSQGSAYDDASGSSILLGTARLLGAYWRQHGRPSLTVEFVLFDAEEQGLNGSAAYVFNQRHGAVMPHPIFMINEEQTGVGYPARPFGRRNGERLGSQAATTPLHPEKDLPGSILRRLRLDVGAMADPKGSQLQKATSAISKARKAAFAALHRVYSPLSYKGGKDSAFSASDQHRVQISEHLGAGSDNQPFEWNGLPTVTFSGDYSFYDRHARSWAFPFDQPEDTLKTLSCDAGGSPNPTRALAASFDLSAFMSVLLVQSYAPSSKARGLAVFSGLAVAGTKVTLTAMGASHVQWRFGDGGKASGQAVSHVYRRTGRYTINARAGSTSTVWHISVKSKQIGFIPHFPGHVPGRKVWRPAELQNVAGCH